ncbi:MAG: hypothetical protein Tsb004_17680 [Allomuricauda sp.]
MPKPINPTLAIDWFAIAEKPFATKKENQRMSRPLGINPNSLKYRPYSVFEA